MSAAPHQAGGRIVDLTHPLTGQVPTYPGQPVSLFTGVTTVAENGYLVSEVHARTHIGTHADTPAHFLADGATTFDIEIGRWMGQAWLARVPGASSQIDADDLTFPSQPAHVLLISTGQSRFWGTDQYYRQSPYLSMAAAEKIREAGFGLVGLDFGSPDQIGSATEPCHHLLLGAGVLIIENLAGLHRIDADWCWFCAAPLAIGAGDGGFCRAFAAVTQPRSAGAGDDG